MKPPRFMLAVFWLLVVVAVFSSLGGLLLFKDSERLVLAFHDDAFYYFEVARNVASGNGFTFDGIHPTNGFHPLWLFTLVPIFSVLDGDNAPLRAIFLLQLILITAAVILVFRILRPRIGREGALAAGLAIVALPGAQSDLVAGMESSLLLILLVAAWGAMARCYRWDAL